MRTLARPFQAIGQRLPQGWRGLGLQLGIWFGFLLLYQIARGVADRGEAEAFANGQLLIDAQESIGALIEPELQRLVLGAGDGLVQLLNWTYWNSQFTVIGVTLLWVYLFRTQHFFRLRNTLLLANVLGLIGFAAMPTAPPRFFPEYGFVDTLALEASLNHGSGLVSLASNQFAAMPSLHSADALILGIALILIVRNPVGKLLWACWPAWVWFTVMATGNHYWLDAAAGIGLAAIALGLIAAYERRAAARRPATEPVAVEPVAIPDTPLR